MLPTVTLPKSRLVGFDPSAPSETPVPVSAMVRFGLGAFEAIVTVPPALPAACGAKATLKVVLCCEFRSSGALIPLSEKSAPEIETLEMFTLEAVEFVNVTLCDCELPTLTLPKSSLEGLSPSWLLVVPVPVPVPVTVMLVAASEASLLTVTFALNCPAALGENITLRLVVCPEEIVTGRLGAVNEKQFVEADALLMVTVPGPVLLARTVRVFDDPAATLPKSRLVAASNRLVCCGLD